MESQKAITLKGAPMYIVTLFQFINELLPLIIMWMTFLYGAIQLFLVVRQLIKEFIAERKACKDAENKASS